MQANLSNEHLIITVSVWGRFCNYHRHLRDEEAMAACMEPEGGPPVCAQVEGQAGGVQSRGGP